MHGLHLLADLDECAADAPWRNAAELTARCEAIAIEAGLKVVGRHWHAFGGEGGVTGVVLLAESHLAIHTWPELNAVTFDVYVCNFSADNSAKAEAVCSALLALFRPTQSRIRRIERGAAPQ